MTFSKKFPTSSMIKGFLLTLLLAFGGPVSANNAEINLVSKRFQEEVAKINQGLLEKQELLKTSPEDLVAFVDNQLLSLWSSERTMKGLLGKSLWTSLSQEEKVELIQGFNNTIQRYAQEGFQKYDGQELEFVQVKLNKKQTKGLLTIKIIPNLLPEFNIDLKLMKKDGEWLIYDTLFQGVSYITLKKDGYRKRMQDEGVAAIIESVESKNKGFLVSRREI